MQNEGGMLASEGALDLERVHEFIVLHLRDNGGVQPIRRSLVRGLFAVEAAEAQREAHQPPARTSRGRPFRECGVAIVVHGYLQTPRLRREERIGGERLRGVRSAVGWRGRRTGVPRVRRRGRRGGRARDEHAAERTLDGRGRGLRGGGRSRRAKQRRHAATLDGASRDDVDEAVSRILDRRSRHAQVLIG